MGNALRKAASLDGTIDGGASKLHSRTASSEYEQKAVQKLILARRLAPFYEGLSEARVHQADAESISSISSGGSGANASTSQPARGKEAKGIFRRRREREREEIQAVSLILKDVQTECPICFLYFPKNINKTLCCSQQLCTTCFVSMRKPPSGRTMSCPFCNKRDFAVTYKSPRQLLVEELGRAAKTFKAKPVKCESIRLYRPPPIPATPAYRAATVRRYVPYAGPPFSVRYGNRATTYGGGVLVLYDEYGSPIYVPDRTTPRTYNTNLARYQPLRPGFAYPGQASTPDAIRHHAFSMTR